MNYVIIDDEKRATNLMTIMLERSSLIHSTDSIQVFQDPTEAWLYLRDHDTDIVFLDVEMPLLNGMDLAEMINADLQNPPEIIFVTAFPQYALNAWNKNAVGYILKPYDLQQIEKVLQRAIPLCKSKELNFTPPRNENLSFPYMRCFPTFDILINNQPLSFHSKKAKELLALLVHHEGNWVTLDKITFALFENMDEQSSKNYCRTLLYRLKHTLSQAGCDAMIESQYGKVRVVPEQFSCDYYEYLNGKTGLFKGEYMGEYTWAEDATAAMWERLYKQDKHFIKTRI